MKYVLSGLVGFLLTLALSIPLQQLIRLKEAQAVSLKAKSPGVFGQGSDSNEYFVNSVPLASTASDPKEPRIKFLPQYPPEAAAQKVEGYVTLSFQVIADGSVQSIKILESQPATVFDAAAKRAVSRWNFGPQPKAGLSEQKLRLVFNLKKGGAETSVP